MLSTRCYGRLSGSRCCVLRYVYACFACFVFNVASIILLTLIVNWPRSPLHITATDMNPRLKSSNSFTRATDTKVIPTWLKENQSCFILLASLKFSFTVDCEFQAAEITVDVTKFRYALTAIEPRYIAEVRDIIMNPPAERPYETLKAELIKRLTLSQERKTFTWARRNRW